MTMICAPSTTPPLVAEIASESQSSKRRSGLELDTFQNSFLPVKEFSFREIRMILHIIETQNFI